MPKPLTNTVGAPIETRTIEQVPLHERHGKAWHLAPFWFAGNFVLTTLAVGFIGPSMSLPALTAIMAIFIGVGLGTLCMALHANQGPRLGLAQMIQSRAQFGVKGAILPFAAVLLVYIGFNVFNLILAGEVLSQVLDGPTALWQLLVLLVAVAIAIVGHDLLHTVQRWLTYVLIAVFAVLSFTAVDTLQLGAMQHEPTFSWPAFLSQLSAAAAYQISYAVYVSDYSRYLPADTPARRVIGWTYLGAAASALWLMSLGALLASSITIDDPINTLRVLGDRFSPGFGTFAILVTVPALVGIMAVNCYGAMLTGATAISAIRPTNSGVGTRVAGIGVIACLIYLAVILLPAGYLDSFNLFLQLMLYFLMPWSAINLIDFYLLRKGQYLVAALFDSQGIYGRWAWPGMLAYLGALVAMVPFASLGSLEGWVVVKMGGVNLAFLVGFIAAAGLYVALTRKRDRLCQASASDAHQEHHA